MCGKEVRLMMTYTIARSKGWYVNESIGLIITTQGLCFWVVRGRLDHSSSIQVRKDLEKEKQRG